MQVIVVGGGLAGLSAAHTVLERGGRVLLLDKNPFCGGNSTKATSGINGTPTQAQQALGIHDSRQSFENDTAISAAGGVTGVPATPLAKVLTGDSGPAVDWLMERFGLDLSKVSRLGGHSFPRTHRGKERFPGMTITYGLMEKLEEICKNEPHRARVVVKARVFELIQDSAGKVIGVKFEHEGTVKSEYGPVVIATGGFAADYSPEGLLMKLRPDLAHLPTTNGEHCTGDGIKMSTKIGAGTVDLAHVQVHPTGLIHPDEPNAKVLFLAAEALRGVGGIILNKDGDRFCNEIGRRDYVTGEMWKNNKGPYRLVLNGKAGKELDWHVNHYTGRGLMKHFNNGQELAKEMGISPQKLQDTFSKYNAVHKNDNDPYGKKYFHNMPVEMSEDFWVSIITPVVHYCMGGIQITPRAEVCKEGGKEIIPGLFAGGEVAGGIHGKNRLGGSSLLDCVVFGRVSGASAAKYLLEQASQGGASGSGANAINVSFDPSQKKFSLNIEWTEGGVKSSPQATPTSAPTSTPAASQSKPSEKKEYTMEEVAKHNTEKDCWVVVNGEVLDATSFLPDHPGGKKAILLYAGKDATAEFNMLHKPDVVQKYAPNTVIGTLKKAKL